MLNQTKVLPNQAFCSYIGQPGAKPGAKIKHSVHTLDYQELTTGS